MENFKITKFNDHIKIKSNLPCVRVEPSSVKLSTVVNAGGGIKAGTGDISIGTGEIKADYSVPSDWSDIFVGVSSKK